MTLGLRCWPDKFAYAVVDGPVNDPELVEHDVRKFPADLSRPGFLTWISAELKAILRRRKIEAAAFKQIEPNAKKNSALLRRAEVEGVVQSVLYESGCQSIVGLTKLQIKAQINFGGPGAEIARALLTTKLAELHGTDTEEAALAAWATLD